MLNAQALVFIALVALMLALALLLELIVLPCHEPRVRSAPA
ncbi:hypothetical protein [Bradyrhizobium sp. McL0616]